ncbi:HEAT repeat domain-containing protein [Baaleninema sp.]|uniref:HEAT repeat domain-containing protein n=1 Tax=Baaleninema sp. TaxID=3101197 RepID=UPI003D07252E
MAIAISLPMLWAGNSWSQEESPEGIESVDAVIRPYIQQLIDENKDNNEDAREEIQKLGDAGVEALVEILDTENTNPDIRQQAIIALRKTNLDAENAVPLLVEILENDANGEVRSSAAYSFYFLEPGGAAQDAIDPLVKALQDDYQHTRLNALISLQHIAPTQFEVVEGFLVALQDDNYTVRSTATRYLGESLSAIESPLELKKTRRKLEETLNNTSIWSVQLGIATALASSGKDLKTAVRFFTELLEHPQKNVRQETLSYLPKIAKTLRENTVVLTCGEKQEVEEGINQMFSYIKDNQESLNQLDGNLDSIIQELENTALNVRISSRNCFSNTLQKWISNYPKLSAIVIYCLSLSILWSLLLYLYPIALLRINESLKKYADFSLPKWLGGFNLPTRFALLVGFYNYHPRVLDAWVKSYINTAREEFNQKQTVRQREIHISIPVVFNGKTIPELSPQDLKPGFKQPRECILIWGEGGSGKTSLALQLAKWAMSDDIETRLCKHQMLPILIEQDLDFEVPDGKSRLTTLIRGLLCDLINSPKAISEEFLEELLRQQRLLVILDGFSEMTQKTRQQIHPELPSFPINASIVTSRIEEELGKINRTTIKPLRIQGNRLSSFMESYLTKIGKRDLFSDREFFEICSKLSELAGDRGQTQLTVLLAKMYADRVVAAKASTHIDYMHGMPNTVTDLMLQYLKILNQSIIEHPLENRIVYRHAKRIAWECLKHSYQPTSANREEVLSVLGDDKNAKLYLDYLENRLGIIKTIDPGEDRICFLLDPLAENLAALYLVEQYESNPKLWHDFLNSLDDKSVQSEASPEFLASVYDCCLTQSENCNIPYTVLENLKARINFSAAEN